MVSSRRTRIIRASVGDLGYRSINYAFLEKHAVSSFDYCDVTVSGLICKGPNADQSQDAHSTNRPHHPFSND